MYFLDRLEPCLRKIAWAWVEEPVKFYSVSTALGLSVAGAIYVLRRLNSNKSKPQSRDLSRLNDTMLRKAILDTVKRSNAAGYLLPLVTSGFFIVEDRGIPFAATMVDKAATEAKKQSSSSSAAAKHSPKSQHPSIEPKGEKRPAVSHSKDAFRELDPVSVVGTIGATHSVVLNKFPVLDEHCVIVTTDFVPQAGPMSVADMGAMWQLVAPLKGFGFYNSGEPSGASQPRRHMQAVPPRALWDRYPHELKQRFAAAGEGPDDAALPVDFAVRAAREAAGYSQAPGSPFTLPAYASFPHSVCVLGGDIFTLAHDSQAAAERLHGWYIQLLQHAASQAKPQQLRSNHVQPSVGNSCESDFVKTTEPGAPSGGIDSLSHNLLLTRRWMMAVPRAQPEWGGLPINALAYAGLLLAKDGGQKGALLEAGPVHVLRACAAGDVADA